MPVTLAHPAAVLPILSRSRRMLLPLLVGSMTPDLPYYLPKALTRHSPNLHVPLIGFSLGVMITIVLCIVLTLSRRVLVAGLWGRHAVVAERLLSSFELSPIGLLLAIVGALIGIATHLAWDAMTKRTGWLVEHVLALRSSITLPIVGSIEVFRLLQYVSSVAGLAVVTGFYISRLRLVSSMSEDAEVNSGHARRDFVVIAVAAGIVGVAASIRAKMLDRSFHGVVYEGVTVCVGIFAALYVVAGALNGWRRAARSWSRP